jgi:hypothetical protein
MNWGNQWQLNLHNEGDKPKETNEETTEEITDKVETEVEEKKEEEEESQEEIPTKAPEEIEDEIEEETDSYAPFISQLVEEGVLFIDESKEYEDSEAGIKDIINDTVAHKVTEYVNNLPEEARGVLEFIQNGGTLEDYLKVGQGVDYQQIDMDDEDNHKYLLEDYFKLQGLDADEIRDKIETYEDAGILEKEAKLAQKKLIKNQEEEKVRLVEDQKKQAEADRLAAVEEDKKFQSWILNTEDLGGFKVNKAEREQFLAYLTKPTKAGKTQYQLDDTPEERLKMAFFKFKKFDFTDVERKATTKATLNLKKNLDKATDRNMSSGGRITDNRGDERPQNQKLYIPSMWGKSSNVD